MKLMKFQSLAGLVSAFLATIAIAADPVVASGKKSLPGESLFFDNHEAFVIAPPDAKENVSWVWYAPTYGMTTEEQTKHLAEHNPIDRLKPLAAATVPLFLLHGDVDCTVPLEANSKELAKRYRELGGPVEL
jgi:pimeloyl-ACP methyl ester carboxylesterase